MVRHIRAGALLAFALLGVGACGGGAATTSSSAPRYTVALINGDNADPFFLSIWQGAQAEASRYHMRLIEEAPNTYDYTQQVPMIEDMIARHVNAILLSPDSDFALLPELQKAKAAGIPVVLVNAVKATKPTYVPYVLAFLGTDPLELGHEAGRDLVRLTHCKGSIGIINSVAGSRGDQERGTGAISVVQSECPGQTVLPMQYSLDDRARADSIATDLIQANPNLSALYAVDSFTGQGMATAIESLHKSGIIKAGAIDAEPQEVAAMKQGALQFLIAQQPYRMGTQGIDDLYDALTGHKNKITESVLISPVSVTPQNLNSPDIKKVVYASSGPS
jgi:ABC-type sugar transport system substrate-binding protein